jgi:phosphatidylserine synthase
MRTWLPVEALKELLSDCCGFGLAPALLRISSQGEERDRYKMLISTVDIEATGIFKLYST